MSLCVSIAGGVDADADAIDFAPFYKALQMPEDSESMQLGDSIFSQLGKKYRNDTGFGALKSKLAAAEFLAKKMESQLKEATDRQVSAIADGLLENKKNRKSYDSLMVAPAKSFYETSEQLFSKPVKIDENRKSQ